MLRLPSFRYLQPATLREALSMKEDAGPHGAYVAGGTDLYPNMKRRHQEPRTVVSLSGIQNLQTLSVPVAEGGQGGQGGQCTLGAGVTLTQVESNPDVRRHYRVIARAAELVSTPLLRNMGTLGGNLCLDTRCNFYNQSYEWRKSIDFCMKKEGKICWVAPSSPRCWAVCSSDIAPVMVALGATYCVASTKEEREIPASAFYRDDGIDFLAKRPGEILTAVRLPAPNGWDATYLKLRRRGSFDFPVLGVAAWISWEEEKVADARIVLGGVASYPKPLEDAAGLLIGSDLDDEVIDAAAQAAFRPSKPMDNTDHGLAWRKEMTRVYVKRALEELRTRR